MKKLIAITMAALLTLALVACSGGSGTGSTNASTSSAASTSEAAGGSGNVVKVAALESAYGADVWKEIAAAFEEETGITVELTIDKKIEDVIRPGINAGDFPDVIHLKTGREAGMTEGFIRDKGLEPLDDVFALTIPGEDTTVKDKINPDFLVSNLTMPYGDGVTYMMPMFYTNAGLFYDAGLFKSKGWEVPATWDEMWTLADTAKGDSIALFCYPTPGYFDTFFYSLMNVVGGPEFFNKALQYDEGIWETPEADKLFEILQKLCENTERTVPANANNENFTKNQQLILDDAALFMPNGDWVIGEMADAPRADGFVWGFSAIPALKEGGDRYATTWIEQAWMPAGATNKDAGKQFLAFLYSDKAGDIFVKHGAVQPIGGMIEQLAPERQEFYNIYNQGAKPALGDWFATEPIEGLTIYDTYFQPINSLVSGDKTIEEYRKDVISANDRFREALLS